MDNPHLICYRVIESIYNERYLKVTSQAPGLGTMNSVLFVDNFRGFTDAYIPITDVNFLVGENSAGKTSILGLIRLFSKPDFMMGRDFFRGHRLQFRPFR